MSDTARRVAELSPEKRRLLLAQLNKKKGNTLQIRPQKRNTQIFPLSFAQRRLWFLHQLEPASPTYLVPSAYRIQGAFRYQAWEQSLVEVIRRHEILRTTFDERDGQPVQVIQPDIEPDLFTLPVVDLGDLSDQEREDEAHHLARQESQQPIDLARGPLLRSWLLRMASQEHLLLLTLHHIITDGWSNTILQREMVQLYQSFGSGASSPLAPLPIQYADYAFWQREWLQGEVLQQQLTYWKKQLAAIIPLELSTDYTRPAEPSGRGALQSILLPRWLQQDLILLSRREEATLFMTLLAAFQVLLMRYSGQRDISVGTPIANRRHAELEGLIGFFVNTLVLRSNLDGQQTFVGLLRQVRRVALEAYAHQDVPFEMLVEQVEPQRDLSRSPLFQAMFDVVQPASDAADIQKVREAEGLLLTQVQQEQTTAKFDLNFTIVNTEAGLLCGMEYSTDLFTAETIQRLLQHWQTLLEGIVANPQSLLVHLPLLNNGECHRLLVEWNATEADYPQNLCLHELFEAQVERTPEAVAVVWQQERLTYSELNARANQLARYLRQRGVSPEMRLGICLERSFDLMVGLLGILKAGAAYLPLDPAYPAERLAFIMQDAQVSLILTTQALSQELPGEAIPLVCMDQDREQISQYSRANLSNRAGPQNPAYIIYTSGSTGQPKGTLIAHQAMVNHNLAVSREFALQPEDHVLQFASISFDVAIEEIFPSWLSGAALVLRPDDLPPPKDFLTFVAQEQLSVLNLPTAYWHNWVADLEAAPCPPSLRLVVVGGEAALSEKLALWQQHVGDAVRWLNAYGPTETTITSTVYEPQKGESERLYGTVPLGRPLANRQVYVLDTQLQPVPIGVPGELYIGGVGLARGYHNHPDLTAARFLPHPFCAEPGARLYRTGDLARYHANGNLEFLGRTDHQAKVRGYRIELGEIEAVLRAHPEVVDAVVLAWQEEQQEHKQLVAYVVARKAEEGGAHSTGQQLKDFVRARLPEYMVPALVQWLDALPLTVQGKINRRALPAPQWQLNEGSSFTAPRNQIEATLVAVWRHVLRLNHVSVHDNFFALGGDSILSIQIVARARQAGLQLTPKQIFQHQTVAQLATVVTVGETMAAEQAPVVGLVPLTPIQRWFFAEQLIEPHHYNQAMMLEFREPLQVGWLYQALWHLLAHHDALRLYFVPEADGWQQYSADLSCLLPFLYVDLARLMPSEQDYAMAALAASAQASLTLSVAPLFRAICFGRGPQYSARLLWLIHHLLVDGVSWRILLADLQIVYRQLSQAEAVALPPKTTSFQRWALGLEQFVLSDALQKELACWLAPSRSLVAPLPLDYPAGDNVVASSQEIVVTLDREQTQALLQQVPTVYHTQINDVLLAALAEAFAAWTGQRTLLVDLEGHGREEILEGVDLSRTVGWFTTVFPVLLDIRLVSGPGAVLKSVKEQLRQLPQHGIGYGLLRYLSLDQALRERLAEQPPAQVSFNYLGQFDLLFDELALLRRVPGHSGLPVSPRAKNSHLLALNGGIVGGQLHMAWQYSSQLFETETIQRLADRFIAALQQLIIHCLSVERVDYTPSDFPLAALEQSALDQLVHRLRQKGVGKGGQHIADIYPLSPMQSGILFHSLYTPEAGMYCERESWIIHGTLDRGAWYRAWQKVTERHTLLRTLFVWQDVEQPLQVVCQQVELPYEYYDWLTLPEEEQQKQLARLQEQDWQRGFDLESASLQRLVLVRLKEDIHHFSLIQHHLLLDLWSKLLLFKEVQLCYQAYCQGKEPVLEAARPYSDYIQWLQRQDRKEAQQFWRRYLAGFSTPTRLFVDRQGYSRRGEVSLDVRKALRQCSREVTSALQQVGQQYHLTMSTLLLGAWALLLARYSGQEEVLFGATVTGRPAELSGVESMIGLFINTLPVRVRIDKEQTVQAWLWQLQEQQAEARQYDYMPLVELQQWSEVPAEQALFESLLLFQSLPKELESKDEGPKRGLVFEGEQGIEQTSFPLSLSARVNRDRLAIELSYDQARFATNVAASLLDHLQMLLEAIAGSMQQRLKDLPLLSEKEQYRLLVEWNTHGEHWETDQCFSQLIEARAEATPDRVAVIYEEMQLTYRELLYRADLMARHLQEQGIGPESLVAILAERSELFLIAILAVFKAGGAYLPLDPQHPPARLRQILRQSGTSLVLVGAALASSLSSSEGDLAEDSGGVPPVLWIEEIFCQASSSAFAPVRISPRHLSYVIYTSGSTGAPKGVMIEQRGMINHLYAKVAALQLGSTDRVAQTASQCFDISVWQFLVSLLVGGSVCIYPDVIAHQPDELLKQAEKDGLTVLEIVPSLLKAMVDGDKDAQINRPELSALRWLLLTGEELPADLCHRWLEQYPRVSLLNAYGPTECSDDVSHYHIGQSLSHDQHVVAIGSPIQHTQLYILNFALRPVPLWVPGELFVGGIGVGRGYLNHAALTATQFIPNPFSPQSGERLYRTGDLARYAHDGTIEFLGRLDHQVKLRGYRIELGEIEALLSQHPQVQDAVIVLHENTAHEKHLVAYVVPKAETAPSSSSLQQFLQALLPAYMVPTLYVSLERLPLTANGKLDRKALPAVDLSHLSGEREYQAPGTPIEELLAGLWTNVLEVERVGIHDNFFEIGGHSLLATRLVARLRKLLGVEVQLRVLFESPTISGLARRVEQALGAGAQGDVPELVPQARPELIPLSFAQQRLWVLDQLEPESVAYLVPNALRVQGTLYPQALERALQEMIRRHESLRTTFEERDGQPIQVIQPTLEAVAFILPVIDLASLSHEAQQEESRHLATQEELQPFDLARGPLLRGWLLRLAAEEHVLLLTLHHIITDAWSSMLLQRELYLLYQAFVEGQPSPLEPLPIQYADYALWQRSWLQGEVLQKQLNYWKKQLVALTPLELPTDHPRPAILSGRGASQYLLLPQELLQNLTALSRRKGVTLFMTLLAAFQVLLARYSGQHDISVGTPIANRRHAELEGLVGFFTNTLVLRGDLTGNPSFEDVLEQVRDVALSAYAHQDVPFEKLVEELQPERDVSRSPLFQVMFILQQAAHTSEAQTDLTFGAFHLEGVSAKFDLTLALLENGQELHSTVEYNTDLFDEVTIVRFLQRWRLLLETIVREPQRRLDEFSLFTEAERDQILHLWNATQATHPTDICLHELFAEQARNTPDTIAVLGEDEHLSYGELDYRANQLARHLRSLGVKQNMPVGLCVERSLKMTIGILGILKAGGAYLPLDPAYPQERLVFMLEQASISVVVVQPHLSTLFAGQEMLLVDIENDWRSIQQESGEQLQGPADSEQLLYIIFTSGSTGKPKGIAMAHRALCNLIQWQKMHSRAGAGSRTLQFTSLSFDVACQELFATWCTGGCVTLVTNEVRYDPSRLLHMLAEGAIERLFLPFVALQQIAETAVEQERYPAHLEEVITAGEQLQVTPAVRSFFGNLANGALFNQYGPAECHVVTAYELERQVLHWPPFPAIGSPVANTQIYLLDDCGYLQPIGLPGELYIGGVSLAHGYFNRPELTAERFVPDPFSREPGGRLYKTGDLARYVEDGNIQFLGRKDHQVKIRGYRIEPGEIEAVLSQYSAVKECVVAVREVVAGNKQLVAYLVPRQNTIATSELRVYLKEKLPDYMIPAVFMQLEDLPLTPSGKVDRRALPAPEPENGEAEELWEASSPLEELLSEAWSHVLAHPPRSKHENFFEVGGHSLLATRLVARLRKLLGVEIPLRVLFEAPTITSLVQRIEQVLGATSRENVPELVPQPRPERIPLSFAQQRLWFLDQLMPESTAYLLPGALKIQGTLYSLALESALREVICRHEVLRTTFEVCDGLPVQLIAPISAYCLPLVDLQALSSRERQEEVQRLAQQEEQRPFDLAHGPLLRNWLLRETPREHLLLLTLHHIITDGWSNTILQREVAQLYQAFAAGEPSPLAPLPVQYADYALWQRDWLQGEVLERQVLYWKEQLSDLPPLDLPTDYPRPAQQTYRGTSLLQQLPQECYKQLQALSRLEGVTLFMTLLAAFQVLLARYTHRSDIAVGTPIANRNHAGIEGLIGFFVNTLVMRSDLSGNPTFQQALQSVREMCLGAYAHQDVPFERLVEVLQPERDLDRSPFFQVMFVFQSAKAADMPQQLQGITMQLLPQENLVSKFELTLSITEGAQGLTCQLEYNTDLFKSETMHRLLQHWHMLLEGIIADPEQPIGNLPLLTPQEVQQLLHNWNDTSVAYPLTERCLHELFEEQVERTPDGVALVFEDEQVTYRCLNQRANQLARCLRKRGVALETPVGIYLHRSVQMIVAVLGILKAGGIYLPMDPAAPLGRLAFLLEDKAILVLTQSLLVGEVSKRTSSFFCMETHWQELVQESHDNLHVEVHPASAAYILYTSGSTGQPKGVVIEHRQLENYIAAIWDQLKLVEGAAYAMVQPLTVDSCLTMLFPALLMGGRLYLISRECSLDPQEMARFFQRHPIDYLKIAPSHLAALVAGASHQEILPRNRLIIGGEASNWHWVQQLSCFMPEEGLYNHYGPTETTVGSLTCQITPDTSSWQTAVTPIGKPLANTQVYVVDAQLQPVPLGIVGELYLAGAGLARGYLDSPDLTAQRFVPNPFSREPGARLYRTGDQVRYLRDGNLAFVGRGDDQVKIRGNRVELGEIEAVLLEHSAIRDAVVLAAEEPAGSWYLVAALVAREGASPSSKELQQYVSGKLPDYMVPGVILWRDALPLTPHGKVDRKALLALAQQESRSEGSADRSVSVSQSPVGEIIRGIWKQVLRRDEIGSQENFFEVGGHSLLATQLIARVRNQLAVEVPLRALFESPTIAGLTQCIEQALRSKEGLAAPPLVAMPRPENVPLSFAQQRLWIVDQMAPGNVAYLVPSALKLQGVLHGQALEYALREVIRRHEILRTTFETRDGQPVQVIHPVHEFASFRLPLLDLGGLNDQDQREEAQRLAAQEEQQPIDLAQGPLLRAYLLRQTSEEHILLLTLHHIITDGWSSMILQRELRQLYQAFLAGQPSLLEPLPLQYADYALWQREWLQGEVLQRLLDYWKKQLAGSTRLRLSTDRPRPENLSYRGMDYAFGLSPELSASITALSFQEHVTPFMTLLAAFQVLLYRYTGQTDIVVGTDIANRTHTQTEALIGFFVNLLVLRNDLSNAPTFQDMLSRVRQIVLEAYAHQDAPFEMLVEQLLPGTAFSRTPLVQVLFVLQNIPEAEEMPSELAQVAFYGDQATTAKFELALFLRETRQGLRGTVVYNSELFEADSIVKMIARYEALLRNIIANPATPIDVLDFYTDVEKQQQLQKQRKPIRRSSAINESIG